MVSSSSSTLSTAANELESIRCVPLHQAGEFPPACKSLLYSIEGNNRCFDCGSPDASWASISHGIVLCLQCSGRHRSFGVSTSVVRSIDMDAWSHSQVLCMLEGGNAQLKGFFDRHNMGNDASSMTSRRYKTKAALFYRSNLVRHVVRVSKGVYKGREASRISDSKNQRQQQQEKQPAQPQQSLDRSMSQKAVAATC